MKMQHLQRNQIHHNFQISHLQDIYKHLQHHSGRILNDLIILLVSSQANPDHWLVRPEIDGPIIRASMANYKKCELTSKTFDGIITQVNGFQIREFR